MPYWILTGVGTPMRRIVSLVARKYAVFRLDGPLGRFSDARLDRWAARAGLARSDLFTPFRGNADHRRLMARMLAYFNVEPAKACASCWQDLRDAEALCARCPNSGRCARWLAWGRRNNAPEVFCPNAALFRELEALQHVQPLEAPQVRGHAL
jgi:hypothetical protein